jgi:hypothetical protein
MEYVIVGLVWAVVVGTRLAVLWYRTRDEFGGLLSARELTKRGRRLDASPIGEVPESTVVRVVGNVQRLDRWVVAPMSKRPCAHWRLKVSAVEYSPTARRTYWRTLFERTSSIPFVLRSSDAHCCVDPSLAVVDVKRGRIEEVKSSRRLPADLAEFLENEGVGVSSLPRTKVRFEELIVSFGDKVAIVGAGRLLPRPRNEAIDVGYRDVGPPGCASAPPTTTSSSLMPESCLLRAEMAVASRRSRPETARRASRQRPRHGPRWTSMTSSGRSSRSSAGDGSRSRHSASSLHVPLWCDRSCRGQKCRLHRPWRRAT